MSLAYQKVTDYRLPNRYNFNNEEVWRIVRITGPNALKYGADKFARSKNATKLQFVKNKDEKIIISEKWNKTKWHKMKFASVLCLLYLKSLSWMTLSIQKDGFKIVWCQI